MLTLSQNALQRYYIHMLVILPNTVSPYITLLTIVLQTKINQPERGKVMDQLNPVIFSRWLHSQSIIVSMSPSSLKTVCLAKPKQTWIRRTIAYHIKNLFLKDFDTKFRAHSLTSTSFDKRILFLKGTISPSKDFIASICLASSSKFTLWIPINWKMMVVLFIIQ